MLLIPGKKLRVGCHEGLLPGQFRAYVVRKFSKPVKKSVWTRIRVLWCVWGGAGEFPAPKNSRGIIWNARAKFLNFQLPFHFFDSRDLPRTYLVGPADPLDNSGTGARRRAPTPTDPSAIARYDVFGELAYFFGIRGDVPGFFAKSYTQKSVLVL